jgi:putative chitinase
MGVQLTTDILTTGCGCTSQAAGQWLDALQAAIDDPRFGTISNSPSNVAALLANVGVECGGFTALSENMNYSAARLAQVWPQRYAVDPHATNKIPNDTATRLAGNPIAIASNVYANRMGNGTEQSQDGWNFRAQGPIELTGRDAFMRFFAAVDMPLNTDPSELQQPQLGALSAAWFFFSSGASEYGIQGNFACTVQSVNGQAPCDANQGALRQSRYDAVLPLCSAALPAATGRQSKPKSSTAGNTPQAPQ